VTGRPSPHTLTIPLIERRATMPHARRRLAAFAAAALLALGLAACSSSASGSSGAALRVGFISPLPTPTGTIGWADHQKTLLPALKAAGISSVKFIPFKNGPDLSAAVSGGSVDIATLGDTPALTARANGLDTHLVNQEAIYQDTWLFGTKGGPTTLAGLKGKTIATQVGSYMYRYLVALLDQVGLKGQVKITHVYTTAAIAALKSGGIAAYAAPAGQLADAMKQAGFPLIDKASDDHRDLLGTSVTIVTGKTLKAHPKLPAAWNGMRAKSVADMVAHPTQYYAFAAKATGTTPAVVAESLPVTSYPSAPFTSTGLRLLSGTNSFLAANKLEKSPVDIAGWRVSSD
jgi:sulfonate transport system substrate-binding protein